MRISAIDIGSNAMRMLLVESSLDNKEITILKKFRVPVRLGEDVFSKGYISPKSFNATLDAFREFAKINKEHSVQLCRAVATSACREASNRTNLVDSIYINTGIKLDIIDGLEEARLVHLAVLKKTQLQNKSTMLIDIGGGSVEITFTSGNNIIATKSIELGTVRIINELRRRGLNWSHINIIISEHLETLRLHIHSNCEKLQPKLAIGTGGNLESLGGLRIGLLKANTSKFFYLHELDQIIKRLSSLSFQERVERLHLRPDRADVILPAAMVLHVVLRQAEIKKIIIPSVGLRDGIIWNILIPNSFNS